MVQTQRIVGRRQRIESAIAFALERRWQLAAAENRELLADDPGDGETSNRLGKALTELGDFAGAVEAYEQALRSDPTNAIARKNLARLGEMRAGAHGAKASKASKAPKPVAKALAGGVAKRAGRPVAAPPAVTPLRAYSLIEESARSVEFALVQPNAAALKWVSAGDLATLEATERGVIVRSERGDVLGSIEMRAALRLKRMLEGGNRYAVVVRQLTSGGAVVHIREIHTALSLVGQASFIAPASALRRQRAPRAYLKPSMVRHERDEEDENDEEDEEEPTSRSRPRDGAAADAQPRVDAMDDDFEPESEEGDEEADDEEADED